MPTSPLHSIHEALGARFTDFGGWDMPVQYEGVLSEHEAVRNDCGVFDVSHLGRFRLEGAATTEALSRTLCNEITRIEPGRAQYTMALNEDGGVIDDIIVWRWSEDRVWVLPNGANYEAVMALFSAPGLSVEPLREQTVMLAVQGPNAPQLIESVLGAKPGRFRLLEAEFEGHPVWAAGTGYTGERGGELCIGPDGAAALWSALTDAGALPCGLGARDTLRLEMGYPLWGQDLDETTTPLEAGLEWVVDWDHDFTGRSALDAQRTDGVPKALVGFVMDGRQIPRHGYPVRSGDSVGTVASGNFSPSLGVGIGLAYVSPPPGPDQSIEIEIRGRMQTATQVSPPFISS